MKRTPLERKTPLTGGRPLARSALATTKPMTRTRMKKTPRPSESPFRAEVLALCGTRCAVCQTSRDIQAAHIIGKGQGGPTVAWNGIPLCREHHEAYDQYRLKLRWEHLTVPQLAGLMLAGYVDWDDDGEPFGRGMRRFENMTSGQVARRREVDDR